MKAQDLRIGNIVFCEDHATKYSSIVSISESEIGCRSISNRGGFFTGTDDANKIQPIPLTEEWLVKIGFEAKNYFDSYSDMDKNILTKCYLLKEKELLFALKEDGYYLIMEGEYGLEYVSIAITSIHQLQNLFYSLTGEELTIKEI